MSHHSLVTPIDWKPAVLDGLNFNGIPGHHSLVTPIDWKRGRVIEAHAGTAQAVTTRW